MNAKENSDGILPDSAIEAMIAAGEIDLATPPDARQVQPASLDLRLGETAYRVRASFLPGRDCAVEEKLDRFKLHAFDITGGAVLETGCVYIVPLLESLALPQEVAASANPKSSTGRLDVFTRVIADNGDAFDQIPAGYRGPLYLEISPRTFPVLVRTGSRLAQIRFRCGHARLSDEELGTLQTTSFVSSDPRFFEGLVLSVDLAGGEDGLIGYRGKRHTGVIDVDRPDAYEVADFWEPLRPSDKAGLILDPDQFYILASREAVHVPAETAAEMVPFDPLVGEFRVHYAGFFDPGFGDDTAGGRGSRAVLEVRSREVPFILEHGQTVGRLVYERMAALPKALYGAGLGSNYQGQALKLSKHFRV
ncbi:2'-deoxycytidine 5'-triphosphate deaminase [Afifella sp. YEN Y35]|uniref:2'-deoxycytidine 5'-triphosphate deaminase n=1 Tax=Afifella sp. YEN Y35 TaxID=3388337 RepID=UPI0039E0FCEE